MRSVPSSGVVLGIELVMPRLRKTTRGVAALASPRVPSCFCRDCGDDSRGGCFGEPPSAKFFCRDCGDDSRGGCFGEPPSTKLLLPRLWRRLKGWLLWRAPECQVA